MSTSISPSHDLTFHPEMAALPPAFTTFRAGHFIRPAKTTSQPVAAKVVAPATFAGGYYEIFVAAPLDLDYDEPNAVVESGEVEFVQATASVHVGLGVAQSPADELETSDGQSPAKCRAAA